MADFLITDFGATVSDRVQTAAIQAAIDACFLAGGGRVVVPQGIFLTGGLRLRSHCELYLKAGAILRGVRDPEQYAAYLDDALEPIEIPAEPHPQRSVYPYSRWQNALIKIVNAHNVAIVGEAGSYLDGANVYDPEGEEHYRGPHAINVHSSSDLRFEGYTITDSANWAHAIFTSQRITVRGITVLGGHDGFDIRTCDDVLVEDCTFRTGDDCIAGFDNQNVTVRRCVLDASCSALRLGGTDVLIEDCQGIAPGSFGFRNMLTKAEKENGVLATAACRHSMHTPFLYYCDHRAEIRKAPGNITVRNCRFENPDALFLHPFSTDSRWCCNRPLSSITFENCEITGLSLPGDLSSVAEEPLSFRLKNVRLTAGSEGAEFPLLSAKSCREILFENVTVEGFADAHLITDTPAAVTVVGGTPIRVVEATAPARKNDI
ncbi:MAG: right-handed parallel beta-helix repeat-containing protein [Clostridia bacterium]|nr:right-handed parallel beta-helix repeat-containing protein [Clostridia bacterium]